MKNKFDWKTFLKQTAVIAIPVAFQNLLTSTGSMVDTMMIGRLGEINVAAVGLCAQYSSLMFSCFWGFVGGGMLFFAQYWGARDDDGINWSYGVTLCCMMFVALVFAIGALVFPQTVMNIYTDKTHIQQVGLDYLRIIGFAYPLQIYAIAMSSLLRSTERVKIPLIAAIMGVATNLFLNWVLIYGNLGAPALGVKGAAIATVCAGAVNVLMILVLSAFAGYKYLFMLRRHFKWNGVRIKLFFGKCFPILCNELLVGIGNMVINIVLGRQVDEAIAAVAVFRTIEGMVIGFFAGFSNAASVLVGASVGAGEHRKAYERAWRLIYLCQLTILVLCLTLIGIRYPLLHAMSLSGDSYYYGSGMLIIYSAATFIRMGNWAQNDTYRSAGDAVTGTVLEIAFMYILLLPAVCISGLVLHWPFLLTFALCYVDEPIRYVIMQIHMYSGRWIRPVTPEGKAALPEFRESLDRTRRVKRHYRSTRQESNTNG